jgi:hypothetical protein
MTQIQMSAITQTSNLTLFADNTSILITGKDMQDLTLNLDKSNESI